jgi:hypothetical protein
MARLITWTEYTDIVKSLAHELIRMPWFNNIKRIYGIPRGGIIPAVMLSHLLDKPFCSIFTRYATQKKDLSCSLLVDDIIDTGGTLIKYPLRNHKVRYIASVIGKKLGVTKVLNHYSDIDLSVTVGQMLDNYNSWLIFPYESVDKELEHERLMLGK